MTSLNGLNGDYQGLRALILTRVSGAKQAKMYSHDAQERIIREKLIVPLDLRILDEKRHIIHDTYSGLEYRYREALDRVLAMAERHEFDVLCMEVLDRGLGRKALAREIFRMQLKELGIKILTTDPSDHADDDSLEGMVMRFFKGYKAEDEINDLVRRTSNGRREKALGNESEKREPKIIGQGTRTYGFKYVYDEKGKRVGYELKLDVIYVAPDGTKWTEVTVVKFIFKSAAAGVTTRKIAETLNTMGIPTPYTSKGLKAKNMKAAPLWQPAVISRMIKNSSYYGEHREFKTRSVGKMPGRKYHVREKTTDKEQIVIACPAIVTKELAMKAQAQIKRNFKEAGRHNNNPEESLLRSGYAKCGYCNGNMNIYRDRRKNASPLGYYAMYTCGNHTGSIGRCPGCNISLAQLDTAAKKKIVEIIQDQKEVEAKVAKILSGNPLFEQKKKILAELKDVQKKQASMRKELNTYMQEGTLDKGSREYFGAELGLLAQKEEKLKQDLADELTLQEKYNQLQENLAKFKQRCVEWREKVNDPTFTPPYKFWRDACEYFGITAIVWKKTHVPPYNIVSDPPSIVQLISRSV